MYRRVFNIEPDDDTYMDWAEYSKGGYPVQIYINKDNNAADDDIDIDFTVDLKVYLNQNNQTFIVSSRTGDLDVDLAAY